MMLYLKQLTILVCSLLLATTYAQTPNAIITYKGEINPKYVDSFVTALENKKNVAMGVKQRVANHYYNARPEYFELHIKGDESYYYTLPSLDTEEGYIMGSNSSIFPYYTEKSSGKIIEYTTHFGKIAMTPLKWHLTGEVKKIGKYTCYQAKSSERLFSRRGFYYNRQVIAWFTPEIPLNFGPKNYIGLPGLVLEIYRDKFSLKAIEINLNPEEEVKIIKPKKNEKIITEEESHAMISEIEAERKKDR
ncbi:GLPGLI family protein [Xanthomarina sp. GH4-25]|uniref:GLPGLI family protein n=1 Tax=Xanthomarina sp. GH4-25 TaxID=3349335 RepID=UPI000D672C4E|nr:GLPGLI family protein [Flavobacteriaceae bacterium LYZ1037]